MSVVNLDCKSLETDPPSLANQVIYSHKKSKDITTPDCSNVCRYCVSVFVRRMFFRQSLIVLYQSGAGQIKRYKIPANPRMLCRARLV